MKKDIVNSIKDIAEKLPPVFEWRMGVVRMIGKEINLSPLGATDIFDEYVFYDVAVPEMHAVLHEQQLKDAYKKYGPEGLVDYVSKHLEKESSISYERVINML